MNKKSVVALTGVVLFLCFALTFTGCAPADKPLSLNGEPLESYKVVYVEGDEVTRELAREFTAAVKRNTQIQLICISDAKADTGNEISIGATNRLRDGDSAKSGQYSVTGRGDSVFLQADSPSGLFAAVKKTLSDIVGGGADYNSSPVYSEYDNAEIRAMSFNIRTADVSARVDRVKNVIERNDPDILGVQEVSKAWQPVFAALDGYTCVGKGRDDGGNVSGDEANYILYKTDMFELEEYGTRWYTDTPDKPSVMSGSSYRRIYTYALLSRKSDGTEFLYVNTHMHLHTASRLKAADMLVDFIDKNYADKPVIITGDFNTNCDYSGSTRFLLEPGAHYDIDTELEKQGFSNARKTSRTTDAHATYPTNLYASDNTYEGNTPSNCYNKGVGDIIDYCFARGNGRSRVVPFNYYVDVEVPDNAVAAAGLGDAASDHYPIIAAALVFKLLFK